ncbi:MAG: aspartyl/glutamyl-tRNA amidotransferase subunit C [Treponema sp.]|jgi:aspartyl-tRNA(Asn)/glutamyl-tRNA(Gln) amidotransferase subunit C|nr:aspartyl/glutamyl-tRNA amidotransferase subunit C [Treponema sp.]
MKIEDLQETVRLAHLTMDEEELAGAFPAFEQMLGFFAVMQAADGDTAAFPAGKADLSGPSRTVSSAHFRPDTPHNQPKGSHTTASAGLNGQARAPRGTVCRNLLDNAGDRDGRFIVVPNVL